VSRVGEAVLSFHPLAIVRLEGFQTGMLHVHADRFVV
jgi:hypothetical protein